MVGDAGVDRGGADPEIQRWMSSFRVGVVGKEQGCGEARIKPLQRMPAFRRG